MELWDLFDKDRRPLHRTHMRGAPKNPGEYHTVVEVWTVSRAKRVLLTLRAPEKELYPGRWENTGGSALAGETSRQAAARELWEETGIAANPDELKLLGTCRGEAAFYDIYALRRDTPAEQLTMQPGETTRAQWVTLEQLGKMIAAGEVAAPIAERLSFIRQALENFIETP